MDIKKMVHTYSGIEEEFQAYIDAWDRAEKSLTSPPYFATEIELADMMYKTLAGRALEAVKGVPRRPGVLSTMKMQLSTQAKPTQSCYVAMIVQMNKRPALKANSIRELEVLCNEVQSHYNCAVTYGVTPEERAWTFERMYFESRMGGDLARVYRREREKVFNPNSATLYDDGPALIINCITQCVREKKQKAATGGGGEEGQSWQQKSGKGPRREGGSLPVVVGSSGGGGGAEPPPPPATKRETKTVKATSNAAAAGSGGKRGAESCPFCRKEDGSQQFEHRYIRQCPKLRPNTADTMPPKQVKQLVRRQERCINCLAKNHYAGECDTPDTVFCRVGGCTERHHAVFHRGVGGSSASAAAHSQTKDK